MPTYTFVDTTTKEVFDVIMSMSDYDSYSSEHPCHERYFDTAPEVISGSGQKTDSGFKEVLSRISEAHPTSPLANQHLAKSVKQARSERAVKNWMKKTSSL